MTSVVRFEEWQEPTGTTAATVDGSGNVAFSGTITQGGVLMPSAADLSAYGTWTAFTPTWTAATTNPSIGNGILGGRYTTINDLVIAQYELRIGSTTTFGSGSWYLTYPPVAASFTDIFIYGDFGFGRIWDSSAATIYNVHVIGDNGSTTRFRIGTDGNPSLLSASAPMTWATNDELLFNVIYKAA